MTLMVEVPIFEKTDNIELELGPISSVLRCKLYYSHLCFNL